MKLRSREETLSYGSKILETKSSLIGYEYSKSNLKRTLDLAVSSASLVGVLPICFIAGSAIWLEDNHNPFIDVGNDRASGKKVHQYKLRSMVVGAMKDEVKVLNGMSIPEFKRNGRKDKRITKVGRLLRPTSLDESPQMINALFGHLSVVGPRLPLEADWNVINSHKLESPYKEFIEEGKKGMKFGVTGFYMLFGRHSLRDEDRYALESLYWQKQNFTADLRIIAMTLPALLRNKAR